VPRFSPIEQADLKLSLDKVVAGAKVRGLAGAVPVEVVRTEWIGADGAVSGAAIARHRRP